MRNLLILIFTIIFTGCSTTNKPFSELTFENKQKLLEKAYGSSLGYNGKTNSLASYHKFKELSNKYPLWGDPMFLAGYYAEISGKTSLTHDEISILLEKGMELGINTKHCCWYPKKSPFEYYAENFGIYLVTKGYYDKWSRKSKREPNMEYWKNIFKWSKNHGYEKWGIWAKANAYFGLFQNEIENKAKNLDPTNLFNSIYEIEKFRKDGPYPTTFDMESKISNITNKINIVESKLNSSLNKLGDFETRILRNNDKLLISIYFDDTSDMLLLNWEENKYIFKKKGLNKFHREEPFIFDNSLFFSGATIEITNESLVLTGKDKFINKRLSGIASTSWSEPVKKTAYNFRLLE